MKILVTLLYKVKKKYSKGLNDCSHILPSWKAKKVTLLLVWSSTSNNTYEVLNPRSLKALIFCVKLFYSKLMATCFICFLKVCQGEREAKSTSKEIICIYLLHSTWYSRCFIECHANLSNLSLCNLKQVTSINNVISSFLNDFPSSP